LQHVVASFVGPGSVKSNEGATAGIASVVAIKPANHALLARVSPSMEKRTARLCRPRGQELTQSVTGKKNGEDHEALAVRMTQSKSSYCWPPFGYLMTCPVCEQI